MTARAGTWWRLCVVLGAVVMAAADVLEPVRSHIKSEVWVGALFVLVVLTVLLETTHLVWGKVKMIGWLVGAFLGLYSFVWLIGQELVNHYVPRSSTSIRSPSTHPTRGSQS